MYPADDYGLLADDDELEALAYLVAQSFGVEFDVSRQFLAPHLDDVRAVRRDGRVVAGLLTLPMGQFFGGRRVSMTGIAGVGVAPSERGRGAATSLMQATLRELHGRGVGLSTLYPASYALYRRCGYELAGGHYRIELSTRAIGVSERGLPMRPIERADLRPIERLYTRQAALRTGWLDRSDYLWQLVRDPPRGHPVYGHLVEEDGQLAGYLFYRQEPIMGQVGYHMYITCLAAASGAAAQRLLGFLADHRSQARTITWYGGVDDPLLPLLPERCYDLALQDHWMLRIVDVVQALSERGYPRHLQVRLDLDLYDDVLEANHGRFRVDIEDGAATVRRGGRGGLALDVGALAALYSGHASAAQLAQSGRIQATPAALGRAAAAFSGPPPSLPDFF